MSVGIVVPGISNTVVLMCLGVYTTYIDAVATINFHILVPMGIGLFFGCLLWIRIIKYLFDKYHQATSLCIIGFTIFFVSLILSYKLANLENTVST